MNHISEHEYDCITKADAIEAAAWAADERDAIRREAMARFADIGLAALMALEPVRPNAGGETRRTPEGDA